MSTYRLRESLINETKKFYVEEYVGTRGEIYNDDTLWSLVDTLKRIPGEDFKHYDHRAKEWFDDMIERQRKKSPFITTVKQVTV